jgi:hypothetical protein
MADEELAIAPSEPEAALAHEATETDEPERIPGPEEANQTAEGEAEDEFDDVEYDGKSFKVPKTLKEKLSRLESMDRDYTQKSQTNAEYRKTLEAREAQVEERLQATDEELNLRAQARYIDAELERFKDFGWPQYQEALRIDPLGAQEAWAYAQNLRDTKAGITDQLKTAESKRTEVAQQSFAKRVQETLAEATKIIPGSSPETVGKTIGELADWANSRGIPEQTLKANWSPQLLDLLYHAKVGHTLLTKQATAPKPAQTVAPQPLRTVNGKSTPGASKSIGDLAKAGDMDAYVAARKAGRVR